MSKTKPKKPVEGFDEIYNIVEVSKFLRKSSQWTVRYAVELGGVKIGHTWFFAKSNLERILKVSVESESQILQLKRNRLNALAALIELSGLKDDIQKISSTKIPSEFLEFDEVPVLLKDDEFLPVKKISDLLGLTVFQIHRNAEQLGGVFVGGKTGRWLFTKKRFMVAFHSIS